MPPSVGHNVRHLFVPACYYAQLNYGKRSLYYRGTVIWNNLPTALTEAESLHDFKLQTEVFSHACSNLTICRYLYAVNILYVCLYRAQLKNSLLMLSPATWLSNFEKKNLTITYIAIHVQLSPAQLATPVHVQTPIRNSTEANILPPY